MEKKILKIGLMGGTFDPIHHGHMVLAEQVRSRFNLDEVVFIPSGIAPHKPADSVTDKNMRYEMTLLATMRNPKFSVSDYEIKKDSVSYAIETIKEMRKVYGEETELFFITGADAIMELETWKDCSDLVKLCHFIGATRPGIDELELKEKINFLAKEFSANIYVTEVPALSISSTDIRRRVKYGLSIKYLSPEVIEAYIEKRVLYKRSFDTL